MVKLQYLITILVHILFCIMAAPISLKGVKGYTTGDDVIDDVIEMATIKLENLRQTKFHKRNKKNKVFKWICRGDCNQEKKLMNIVLETRRLKNEEQDKAILERKRNKKIRNMRQKQQVKVSSTVIYSTLNPTTLIKSTSKKPTSKDFTTHRVKPTLFVASQEDTIIKTTKSPTTNRIIATLSKITKNYFDKTLTQKHIRDTFITAYTKSKHNITLVNATQTTITHKTNVYTGTTDQKTSFPDTKEKDQKSTVLSVIPTLFPTTIQKPTTNTVLSVIIPTLFPTTIQKPTTNIIKDTSFSLTTTDQAVQTVLSIDTKVNKDSMKSFTAKNIPEITIKSTSYTTFIKKLTPTKNQRTSTKSNEILSTNAVKTEVDPTEITEFKTDVKYLIKESYSSASSIKVNYLSVIFFVVNTVFWLYI